MHVFHRKDLRGEGGGGGLLTEILRVIDVYHLCLYVSLNNIIFHYCTQIYSYKYGI